MGLSFTGFALHRAHLGWVCSPMCLPSAGFPLVGLALHRAYLLQGSAELGWHFTVLSLHGGCPLQGLPFLGLPFTGLGLSRVHPNWAYPS